MSTPRTDHKWEIVVGGVVAVVLLVVALVIGLEVTGDGNDTTPVVSMVIGLCSPVLISLLALLRSLDAADAAKSTDEKVETILNGVGEAKIKTAVHHALDERKDSE